jgi:hypothetical protein
MVSPDSLAQRARRQAETPLIALFRFLKPALPSAKFLQNILGLAQVPLFHRRARLAEATSVTAWVGGTQSIKVVVIMHIYFLVFAGLVPNSMALDVGFGSIATKPSSPDADRCP